MQAHVGFCPHVEELYGGDLAVAPVDYGRLTSAYEGQKRPGHFDVVAVVRKLFSAVEADAAFLGKRFAAVGGDSAVGRGGVRRP